MPLVLKGLSDEELAIPARHISKEEMFGAGDRWIEKHLDSLLQVYAGKHLTICAGDLKYVIGDNYKDAHKKFEMRFGLFRPGRHMIDLDLIPR